MLKEVFVVNAVTCTCTCYNESKDFSNAGKRLEMMIPVDRCKIFHGELRMTKMCAKNGLKNPCDEIQHDMESMYQSRTQGNGNDFFRYLLVS